MIRKLLACVCVLALGGMGMACGDDTPAVGTDSGGVDVPQGPAMTYIFATDFIDIGAAGMTDPNIVPGFNLDNIVSTADDNTTCNKADFTSPPPDSEPGVDNQLGPVLAGLPGMNNPSQSLVENLADGSLVLLFEITDVNSTVNDPSVSVNIMLGALPPGVTVPMLTGGGTVAGGQTFDVDVRSLMADRMTPQASAMGSIVNGRLRAGPTDVSLSIPIGDTNIDLTLEDAQIRLSFVGTDSVSNGVLGGALDIEATIPSITAISDEFPETTVRALLRGQADLGFVDGTGCTALSVGLVFSGVTAIRGNIVDPPPATDAGVPDAGASDAGAADAGT